MTTEESIAAQTNPDNEPQINKFFEATVKNQASDIHLKVGQPPKFRIDGQLMDTTGEVMSAERIEQLVFEVLTDEQKATLAKNGSLDFGYEIASKDRFRVNVFRQRGVLSLAARLSSAEIPPLESLNLPAALKKICDSRHGLVLVVGPSGCGKTTTAVSMVDYINRTRPCHIVTIEDPIEYRFEDKKAIVSQREIGVDVQDFEQALRYLMREDPDVVLIGEVRDAMTVTAAMRAAETGHLVFGSMHSANASQAIQRLLDRFPQDERELTRQTLSLTIKAIIGQVLIPSIKKGANRIPAVEILLANPEIKKLIFEQRYSDLSKVMRSCREEGMRDMTDSLCELVKNGSIVPRLAYKYAPNPDELKMALKGIRADISGIL